MSLKWLLAISVCLLAGLVAIHADDAKPVPKPAATVTATDEAALRAEFNQARLTIAALQRRLKAVDQERQEAQNRVVLLLDDNLRLADELAALRNRSAATEK